jgi:hypothetical protein
MSHADGRFQCTTLRTRGSRDSASRYPPSPANAAAPHQQINAARSRSRSWAIPPHTANSAAAGMQIFQPIDARLDALLTGIRPLPFNDTTPQDRDRKVC